MFAHELVIGFGDLCKVVTTENIGDKLFQGFCYQTLFKSSNSYIDDNGNYYTTIDANGIGYPNHKRICKLIEENLLCEWQDYNFNHKWYEGSYGY